VNLYQVSGGSQIAAGRDIVPFFDLDLTPLARMVARPWTIRVFRPIASLEITETVLAEDRNSVVRALREMKAPGVAVSIDDFGTDFSVRPSPTASCPPSSATIHGVDEIREAILAGI
jgi:hypothetical protein